MVFVGNSFLKKDQVMSVSVSSEEKTLDLLVTQMIGKERIRCLDTIMVETVAPLPFECLVDQSQKSVTGNHYTRIDVPCGQQIPFMRISCLTIHFLIMFSYIVTVPKVVLLRRRQHHDRPRSFASLRQLTSIRSDYSYKKG